MKIPIILLLSGIFFMFLGGGWAWQVIQSYKISKEKGQLKRWWILEIISGIFFAFEVGALGAIGCFLFGTLLVILAIIGFNHGLAFQKS